MIVILSGVIPILLSVLIHDSHHVQYEVTTEVCIKHGVDIFDEALLDKLSDSKWIGVPAGDQADAVNCDEGSQDGSCMDQQVVEEAQTQDAEEKCHAHGEAPETSLAVHLVQEGVVDQEANGVTTHGCHQEDTDADELQE